MYNHAPVDYRCPICIGMKSPGTSDTLIVEDDFVYRDDIVSVFVNSFFLGDNPGHIVIVPNQHFENIYDLPEKVGHHIADISKRMALTLKRAYDADGITIRQNNEPAGDQHAYHYHLHIFPRYNNDLFNKNQVTKRSTTPEERKKYADKLKAELLA